MDEYAKTMAAFANNRGGIIIFGVKDNPRIPIGIRKETLPSLFKDNSYIEIISENIKDQMRERMKADDGFIYWVDVDENEEFIEPFDKISPNQNFYITEEGKLVISFDKYEVGPGYMGIQEFEIPTEVIADIWLAMSISGK